MPTATFNVGRDAALVCIGPFGTIQLNVTQWRWQDHTHEVMSRPLAGKTQIAFIPDYVSGSFEVDRNSNVLEAMVSQQKAVYYAGGVIPVGKIYATIQEVDGSVTNEAFVDVVLRLSNGGNWRQDDKVSQTVEWAGSSMQVQ